MTDKPNKPKANRIPILITLDEAVLDLIDDQRRLESKIPSRVEAIRKLINIGLRHSNKKSQK